MPELKTSADQLMDLVRSKGKMTVAEAAKALNVSEKTVQSWVDFLVDEHILGVEYKFTTPYIYVHSEERLAKVRTDDKHYKLSDFKEIFLKYAREKQMSQDKLPVLWEEHIKRVVLGQRQFFMDEARRRGIQNPERLFERYLEGLLNGI